MWKTNLETVKQMPFIFMGKVIHGSKAFEPVLKWIGSIVFHWCSHICGNGTTWSDVNKKATMALTTSFNHFGLIQIYISVRRLNGSYEALLSCYPPFATYTHHVMTYRWIVNWIKAPTQVMLSFKQASTCLCECKNSDMMWIAVLCKGGTSVDVYYCNTSHCACHQWAVHQATYSSPTNQVDWSLGVHIRCVIWAVVDLRGEQWRMHTLMLRLGLLASCQTFLSYTGQSRS